MPRQVERDVEVKTANWDVELVGKRDPDGASGSISICIVHHYRLLCSEEILCDPEAAVSAFQNILINMLISGRKVTPIECCFT